MATYYDGLNYIYKLFDEKPPASSTQLVILHLLHENNRHGNTGTFQLSDRELGHRTSLSKQTITEAKRTLKNRGLIDFKSDRGKSRKTTTYTLTFFNELGQNVGQSVGQTLGQRVGQKVGQTPLISYTLNQAQEDRRQQDDAGARGTGDVAAATNAETDAHTRALPLSSSAFDANDIQGEWSKAFGYDLRGNRALELEQLAAKDYGRAQKALERTKSKGESLNDHFAYFKAVYDGLKPTTKEKEKEESESTAEQLRALDKLMATLGKF